MQLKQMIHQAEVMLYVRLKYMRKVWSKLVVYY